MYTQEEEPLQAAGVPQFRAQLSEEKQDWAAYFNDLRRSPVANQRAINSAEACMESMFAAICRAFPV